MPLDWLPVSADLAENALSTIFAGDFLTLPAIDLAEAMGVPGGFLSYTPPEPHPEGFVVDAILTDEEGVELQRKAYLIRLIVSEI